MAKQAKCEPMHSVVLTPKNSNAPTFYNSGDTYRFLLGANMRKKDAERVASWFSKSGASRDYTYNVRQQNSNMSEQWQTQQEQKEHDNLRKRYDQRMGMLMGMYPEGEQPTGGSSSNSPEV